MGRGPEQTLLPRRHTNGQQIHEKMLNFTSYEGNADQAHSEMPPHTCQNGCGQQDKQAQLLRRLWRERDPHSQLVGM